MRIRKKFKRKLRLKPVRLKRRKSGIRSGLRRKLKPLRKLRRYRHRRRRIARRESIAYVIPGGDISGGMAVICQHVNRLMERGVDVVMLSANGCRSIDWFPNQRVPIIPLAEVANLRHRVLVATQWSTAYHVQRMSADRKYYFVQAVESWFYPEGSPEADAAMQSYRFPFIYMTEALWIQRWLKENFNHDSIYVPNGLDETIFHPVPPIEPKGSKVRVLLEGPIDLPTKGMAEAFMAVKDLDCEIWCVSRTGTPDPSWRCDRFFSHVEMGNMKQLYSSCDILLKLSRVEGFFGPPMEMMACGGTAVVGDCMGHDEYIVDGHNALVVPLGNVEAAKLAVHRLIHDPGLRQHLTHNGMITAREWNWNRTIDILHKVYA